MPDRLFDTDMDPISELRQGSAHHGRW